MLDNRLAEEGLVAYLFFRLYKGILKMDRGEYDHDQEIPRSQTLD